jgi:glycosidase
MKLYTVLSVIIFYCGIVYAQSTVDVTFFYYPTDNPSSVYLRGEFNGWTTNTPMTFDPASSSWSATVNLRVGGPNPLPATFSIPGAYQYKFYADDVWLPDPLNPRQNPNDNNNSYLFIRNPTIHLLLPNSTPTSGIVRTSFPEITAYIFPATSTDINTSSISVTIDGNQYTDIGNDYDEATNKFSFVTPDPLGNGNHEIILSAETTDGSFGSDTTNFTVQSGLIQFLTLSSETWENSWRLQGAVFNSSGGFDTTITSAQIMRSDSIWDVQAVNGKVDTSLNLIEGDNYFKLSAEVGSNTVVSDSINIIHKVNHIPYAQIDITQNGSTLTLSGANSTDPDSQQLTYLWKEDLDNLEILGITGQTTDELMITKPVTPGEYYFSLTVRDIDLNSDSTREYFVVEQDSPDVHVAGYKDNPDWVKNARVYLLFFKAFTPTGTIKSAIPNLEYIKAMGFNVIWVLPVTEIPGNVDNQINIGYTIIDFENVESSYGTNQDYKDFINEAHKLGIKVIQDITPNHTGKFHPFAQEALQFGDYSQYWNYYQTHFISHNNNGLGDCVTSEGIWYYCAFSDALLNYNWNDLDAKKYMIDVYDNWTSEFNIDGFRFDVYWGPHRKYGEQNMGIPVRTSLKHIKPDILLLGEDDGVGPGTEVIYADQGGGLDVSYDSRLYFDAIRDFPFNASGVNTLHSKLDNNGYHPGENSYFLRFMENQDEDRISYKYNSFEKTMPIATCVFMAPGIPQMLNGQEVGFGKGMGAPGEPDLNDRRRGIINWNFGGRELLTPHYQKLAQIRAQFPAFSQHRKDTNGDGQVNNQDESDFDRVATGNGIVYSFLRPYTDSNGLTVVNFSNSTQSVTLNLTTTNMKFTGGFEQGNTYWVNDLYNDTSFHVAGSDLANFNVSLSAYGSGIYTISSQQEMVVLPPLPQIVSVDERVDNTPKDFQLFQNYPNPFNPSTTIKYQIPNSGIVTIKIYDILGREIKTLVNRFEKSGAYEIHVNASDLASGVYYYQLKANKFVSTKKMLLLK